MPRLITCSLNFYVNVTKKHIICMKLNNVYRNMNIMYIDRFVIHIYMSIAESMKQD